MVLGNPVAVARADQGSGLQESSDVFLAAISVQEACVDAFVSPEGQHDGLDEGVLGGEDLLRGLPAAEDLAVPGTGISLERMRSRADSHVRAAFPVAAVVDRLEAFLGEIGDFVMVL